MATIVRNDGEIAQQLAAAAVWQGVGRNQTGEPDMSFEDGFTIAYKWLVGESEEKPILRREGVPPRDRVVRVPTPRP